MPVVAVQVEGVAVAKTGGILRTAAWVGLNASDEGDRAELTEFVDRTIQVTGTFAGNSVIVEGSLDGENYFPLSNPQGDPLTFAAAGMRVIAEMTRFIRPKVQGAGAGSDLTVLLLARRTG